MNRIVKSLAALAAACIVGTASAAGGGYPLDPFPTEKLTQQGSLQNGARLFVNYCLNCHGASLMRYNRLADIGLTDEQIKKSLLFTADKVGDPMKIAMRPADAKEWFGALPADLSVIARARSSATGTGSDWLYTYLRSYFRDSTRATGWNNALFENVGMPHVFWELQGTRGATLEEVKEVRDESTGKLTGFVRSVVTFDAAGVRTEKTDKLEGLNHHASRAWTLGKPEGGTMPQSAFDNAVGDLVAFVTYMSDPTAQKRQRLGVWVLLFLGVFTVFAWMLNRAFWKDIK
ncbi:cytochrome c1 [Burkholderiaceae bacterium FT117]|uniref:cytochrome c1 n=1 Tax=Zeimonas sediminis TaxID=2944268 RepID=UPI002342D35B|nr:cytochrome c1 [Zeimonas sediminis]MCM5571830.1 cytochrome c1 [Zeimonas sediminis]